MKQSKSFILFFLICGCVAKTPDYIGKQYLGAKYIINPLGEEKAPDDDPLIRTDAFDCTTFVETSLADGDVDKLTAIRYKDGKIDLFNRNHFTEIDWLENNEFENISAMYGKTDVRKVIIDKKSWFKHVYNIETDFDKQYATIEYIPYKNLSKIDIQSPLIVLFIHNGNGFKDKIGTDLAVVHMGFLLPDGTLRHASSSGGGVIDINFDEYVAKRKKKPNNIGVVLLGIKQK